MMLGFTEGVLLALALIGSFIIIFTAMDKKGLLKRFNMEMSGPFLFWKTEKGKELIDRISQKKKFWTAYGNLAIIVAGICMVLIMGLVVWSAYLASFIPAESAPSPRMIIAMPGVNPIIPVWYGILGLAVSIIVHELSHGIVARLADVKVKTLGLVFLLVPMGAFVEPDEEDMEALPKVKRSRIYAAGPTTNILLALICAILFSSVFMASVSPQEEGMIVFGMLSDSPAREAGIELNELIMYVDGNRIKEIDDVHSLDVPPLEEVVVRTRLNGDDVEYEVTSGLVVALVQEDSPASDAGIKENDILVSMDDVTIRNYNDFDGFMNIREGGDVVTVVFGRMEEGNYSTFITNVSLIDKYEAFQEHFPRENKEEYRGVGYIGITPMYMGIDYRSVDWVPRMMARPFEGASSAEDYLMYSLTYISYPFLRLSPFPSELTSLYEISGPLGALPSSVFWVITNSLYWVFWLNLMVGLFNALPAVPLDGGFIFRDGLSSVVEKFKLNSDTEEKVIHIISLTLAFSILGMLLWQLIGPHML